MQLGIVLTPICTAHRCVSPGGVEARKAHAARCGTLARLAANGLVILLTAALLPTGCAPGPKEAAIRPGELISPFSSVSPGSRYPAGWREFAFSRFRKPTHFAMVDDCGTTVAEASAQGGSSGLVQPLDVDPRRFPVLTWSWKVPALIPGADNTQPGAEDAPARVDLSFAGDKKKLSIEDRVFFDLIKALAGFDMPYATLEYIWGNGAPRETVIINSWTSRIRMLMVESGPQHTGEWVHERRNVLEDYRRAFGEEPRRITAIGINTDSDQLGVAIHAYYGDIALLPQTSMIAKAAAAAPSTGRSPANRPQATTCPTSGG